MPISNLHTKPQRLKVFGTTEPLGDMRVLRDRLACLAVHERVVEAVCDTVLDGRERMYLRLASTL